MVKAQRGSGFFTQALREIGIRQGSRSDNPLFDAAEKGFWWVKAALTCLPDPTKRPDLINSTTESGKTPLLINMINKDSNFTPEEQYDTRALFIKNGLSPQNALIRYNGADAMMLAIRMYDSETVKLFALFLSATLSQDELTPLFEGYVAAAEGIVIPEFDSFTKQRLSRNVTDYMAADKARKLQLLNTYKVKGDAVDTLKAILARPKYNLPTFCVTDNVQAHNLVDTPEPFNLTYKQNAGFRNRSKKSRKQKGGERSELMNLVAKAVASNTQTDLREFYAFIEANSANLARLVNEKSGGGKTALSLVFENKNSFFGGVECTKTGSVSAEAILRKLLPYASADTIEHAKEAAAKCGSPLAAALYKGGARRRTRRHR